MDETYYKNDKKFGGFGLLVCKNKCRDDDECKAIIFKKDTRMCYMKYHYNYNKLMPCSEKNLCLLKSGIFFDFTDVFYIIKGNLILR